MNNETIGQRIRVLRRSKKLTQAQLAKIAGVSSPAVTEWEKDSYLPKAASLEAMASYFNVSAEYLLTGEGESTKESKQKDSNDPKLRKIPILDFVQAGIFDNASKDELSPKGETYTTYQGTKPEKVFSLTIKEYSMSPDFIPGDELVIDAAKAPYPGCFVIAQNGSAEATFKKYKEVGINDSGQDVFHLVPLNSDFPTLKSDHQKIKIIGVVVQHLRSFGE